MPQVIDINNKKNTKKSEIPATEKISVKAKKKFQEEWEKAIPIEDARKHLLKTVRDLWQK